MESNKYASSSPHPSEEVKQPIVLIAQLMKDVAGMRHVDELFSWLAGAMAQYWSIPVVQIWALQIYNPGQIRTEMRAGGSTYSNIPRQAYSNTEIAATMKRLLYEQQHILISPIKNMFSPEQTYVLTQYNLHYWAGCFLRLEMFLPPMSSGTITENVITPLNIGVAIFIQQAPPPNLLRAINFSIMQGLRMAESRGLLSSIPFTPANNTEMNPLIRNERRSTQSLFNEQHATQALFNELIPARAEDVEGNQANNPLGKAFIITEKDARRLYSAIDGQRNISEIAQKANLSDQEVQKAMRYLLENRRIQLYKAGGEIIDNAAFLAHLSEKG